MKLLKILTLTGLIILISGCELDTASPDAGLFDELTAVEKSSASKTPKGMLYKATGFVEIVWKGADKGSDMGNKPDALLAFMDISALQKNATSAPVGELTYLVLNTDLTLHREIKAEVVGLHVNKAEHKAWILGRVVSDSKGCGGNGSGGHDSGCEDGGCSHDDTDGGCSHDDTDGGCSGDDTSHDGGCDHDDTGTDGGCSDGGSGGSPGGMGGPGGPTGDMGNPLSGKNCRIGQYITLKMHDKGTPGAGIDGTAWKWRAASWVENNDFEDCESWTKLCKKTIIGGNLVVHD